MTPDQESKDTRQFWILFGSNWLNFILTILLVIVYVTSCRQNDKAEIKDWIESVRCSCDRQVNQHNDQRVTVNPNAREETIRQILKDRERAKLDDMHGDNGGN